MEKLNRKEKYTIRRIIENYMYSIEGVYNSLASKTEDLKAVTYTNKQNGQFGYYPSRGDTIVDVYSLMKYLDLLYICDLGAGILVNVLNNILRLNATGVEIEESLVKVARDYFQTRLINQDIFTLTKKQFSKWQAIYFYEPFADHNLSKKFVKLLEKNCFIDQYIFYNPAGAIEKYLDISKYFEYIDVLSHRIQVYKKIK